MNKFLNNIKRFSKKLLDSQKYSPYVKDYLFTSNVRSSIYVALIVATIEIWMLITVISGTINADGEHSFLWVLQHTASYAVLFAIAIVMLIYSILYLKGKTKNKTIGFVIKILFALVGLSFGIYISYISYDASGQVFVFVTMEIFCLCLFVWHPVNTFIILLLSFSIYLYLQHTLMPISYSIKVNSFTLWIALLMTGINLHHQRRTEAQKDENLEKLNKYLTRKSYIDELTGLANLLSFQHTSIEMLQNEKLDISKMRFVFMDVENFKNYNEKYGFRAGNLFLKTIGHIIGEVFSNDVVARFSDDHFIALAPNEGLTEKLETIKNRIHEEENTIQLGLKSGIYTPQDRFVAPSIACDHARYACESIKKHFSIDVAEYTDVMNTEFNRKQYIINNIDNALEKGYIKVFYQPVVWADGGKLCGAEALARWNDPEFGFLLPGAFISILEEYHLIHKLDMYVMEQVCKDLQDSKLKGKPVIPTSINFSRIDFDLAEPLKELERCVKQYGISKNDIHVEITESALTDSDQKLKQAMIDFREHGYSLWLDDFGSGYSGLNVLKDFNFDMMKLDMKFLNRFSENQKTQPIISGIVSIAQSIGMQTLTEGVETQEARDFLQSIGCQRLQGYLFGKPMTKEELFEKIQNGVYDASAL